MTGPPAHLVLEATDAAAFASLRRPSTPRAERYALGRRLRQRAPRSSLGRWKAPADRTDPVDLVLATNQGRVERLIPVRIGRMAATPFAFLRGAAAIMAEDFAGLPATGILPGDLRRRPPEQLRVLRLAGARPRLRPQRLRRGPPRGVGVGPAPARRERLDGRAAERLGRDAVRRRGRPLRAGVPRPPRAPGRAAAAGTCLRARRPRPAARRRDRPRDAARDRAGGAPRPPQDQRPGAAAVHRGRRRTATGGSSPTPR